MARFFGGALAPSLALVLLSPVLAQPVAPVLPVPLLAEGGQLSGVAQPGDAPFVAPASEMREILLEPPEEALPRLPVERRWVVNFVPTEVRSGPDESSPSFGVLRQFTYLEVLAYEGEWAYVQDPRNRSVGYVRSRQIGPTTEPPAYITADPPPALETLNVPGRVVGLQALSFYPTPDEEAQTNRVGHNSAVFIKDTVLGEDGETWYRTDLGDYFPSAAVRLPRPPPRTFSGRWIDADLREPVMVTAYEDDRPVMSAFAVKGTGPFPTPTGVFTINRRVANETMDSRTIGIPREAQGGYFLKDVLFTQYFLGSGESFHYNYWASNFGYAGSHGCLGMNYEDSEFLWRWATIGTPVSVHT